MGELQKIMEKTQLQKWFRKDNLIVLVLVGIILLVMGLPTEKEESVTTDRTLESSGEQKITEQKAGFEAGAYNDVLMYGKYLEKQLEEALANMQGVGEVNVMITLEATEEQVIEKDQTLVRENTTENDAKGGSRMVYDTDSREVTVYGNNGAEENPYVTKIILPRISGIVIVAQGAGTGTINKTITEIAQALFDVEVHKIKVVSMKQNTTE